ncbi:hypothetical protein ACLOJK_025213 [Asimina triloba]
MGISFKVSKAGTRFRAKPAHIDNPVVYEDAAAENSKESSQDLPSNGSSATKRKHEAANNRGEDGVSFSLSPTASVLNLRPDHEVSFTLNLFEDGFTIGKPSEKGKHQSALQDVPKPLHPYDKTCEALFSAIESGRLPGDLLDDIPGKYLDGTIVCEVRDYRKCTSEPGDTTTAVGGLPIVHKVLLRMSLENVVKDIPLISDDSWTYSDLMEVESRILKALQPQLCLDPTPKMDRLCGPPLPNKLDLGIHSGRRKRLRQAAEVTITSNNQIHGKKVSIDKATEAANCYSGDSGPTLADAAMRNFCESANIQHVASGMPALRAKNIGQESPRPALSFPTQPRFAGSGRMIQDRASPYAANISTINANNISSSGADLVNSYTENINPSISSIHGKRENQDGQLTPMSGMKRPKQIPMGLDSPHQQPAGAPLDSLHGTDINWKNSMFHQQQSDVRGIQYATIGGQKYSPQVMNDARQAILQGTPNQDAAVSFYLEQQGMMRYGVKEERTDTELQKSNSLMLVPENNQLDAQQSRLQRQPQQQFMRSPFSSQTQWQNLSQLTEKDLRKDDMVHKRKSVQSPRVSSGPLVQSPASSKSGEISSGSFGPHFGAVTTTSALASQKEKSAGMSGAPAVGTPSVASSPSDSMQRQHQAPAAAKRRSNSVPKTQGIGMTGVGSPVSVSNMNIPLNASSPSVGTPSMPDQATLDRFSKIEMLTQRYQLNCKKSKAVDHRETKPVSYSPQQVSCCLAAAFNVDDPKETIGMKPLSKSLFGGSMNVCKSRSLTFLRPEPIHQGNVVYVAKTRNKLTLIERLVGGMVAMQLGDMEDIDLTTVQEYGPRLPNTMKNKTFAKDLRPVPCIVSFMQKEGFELSDDQIRPIQITGPSSVPGILDNAASELQYPETISGQQAASVNPANNSGQTLYASQNALPSPRMLQPGNSQAPLLSPGYIPGSAMPSRPLQLDQTSSLQQPQNQQSQLQQQHQHTQLQRPSLLHPSNPLSQLGAMGQNPNMQMGNPMISKASQMQQLQMLQQQPQQQAQQQQQQQQQSQRKMMMGLGAGSMGMGNMGNSMVGLSSLSNVVGMGGVRAMGNAISAPMGSMSGLGNMGQGPMNPSQARNARRCTIRDCRDVWEQPDASWFTRLVNAGADIEQGQHESIAKNSNANYGPTKNPRGKFLHESAAAAAAPAATAAVAATAAATTTTTDELSIAAATTYKFSLAAASSGKFSISNGNPAATRPTADTNKPIPNSPAESNEPTAAKLRDATADECRKRRCWPCKSPAELADSRFCWQHLKLAHGASRRGTHQLCTRMASIITHACVKGQGECMTTGADTLLAV